MEFSQVLREIRLERGLSLQQMAELLGTSRQVLSRYENNKRTPKLSTVVEYAAKLHVPVSLLTDENIPAGFLESYESIDDARRAFDAAEWSAMMDDRPQTPREILKGLAKAVGASIKVRSGQIIIKVQDKTYTFSEDESEHYVRECAEYLLFMLSRRG